jgi:tetratricopeptide (TPR) repeat protein
MMQLEIQPIDETLSTLDNVLVEMLKIVVKDNFNVIDLKDLNIFDEFGSLCYLIAHISFLTIQNRKNLDKFGAFCCRGWVLFFYFIRHVCLDALPENHAKEVINNSLSEILAWAHIQLGFVSICCADSGDLLKLIIEHVSTADEYFHYEIYQSCSCLYGTDITQHQTHVLEDHKTEKAIFGTEAATSMFKFIKPYVDARIVSFQIKPIPKDIRNCLDMITPVFSELPKDDKILSNHSTITKFLQAEISLKTVSPRISQHLLLYTPKNISLVYHDIFFFKAKISMNEYYAKPDMFSKDNVMESIRNFIFHLSINPNHIDSWVCLGNLYSQLCYEILGDRVLNYSDKLTIQEYMKASFHSFVRAIKLCQIQELDNDYQMVLASLLWGDFGILLQCFISAPIDGLVLKTKKEKTVAVWGKRAVDVGSMNQTEDLEEFNKVNNTYLFGVMAYVLKKAIIIDEEQWAFYFRLAHCYRKLRKDPMVVVQNYAKALELLPKEFGTKDQDSSLDILYKCVSFIFKSYQQKRLSDQEALDQLEYIVGFQNAVKDLVEKTNLARTSDKVINQILTVLECLKKLDKRKWFHKPYYRIAKIYSDILKNDMDAKEEMILLLNGRSKQGMRRIWKTDLELHGRHFIYFHTYLKTLIKLSNECEDIHLLWMLCRRLRVQEDAIMFRFQLWLESRQFLIENIKKRLDVQNYTKLFEQKIVAIDSEVEKVLVSGYPFVNQAERNTEIYHWALLCDLKRNRKTADPDLDAIVVNLYCKLYLKAGTFMDSVKVGSDKDRKKLLEKVLSRSLIISKGLLSTKSETEVLILQ